MAPFALHCLEPFDQTFAAVLWTCNAAVLVTCTCVDAHMLNRLQTSDSMLEVTCMCLINLKPGSLSAWQEGLVRRSPADRQPMHSSLVLGHMALGAMAG
jgi:hypothetical protein